MKTCRLIAIAALSLGCSCGALADPLATQAALDALFSIEAIRPEGSETVVPPEGFSVEQPTEPDLIAFLALQKKRGANFNAYRHKGTVLHHAIRGGLEGTALWLLKNGADPRLPIQADVASDALGVAIQVHAQKVIRALVRSPAFLAMSAKERSERYWPQAMQTGGQAAALMNLGFPLPRFDTTPDVAHRLLTHGLCTGQIRLVQALVNAEPAAQPVAAQAPGAVCAATGVDPSASKVERGTLAEWKAIEQRLHWTLLPYLIAGQQIDGQIEALLSAGLRSPWTNPVTTRQTIFALLNVSRPAVVPLLRAVPRPALQAALQDAALSRLWFAKAASWPLADLDWALAQASPADLSRQLPRILSDWDYAVGTRRDAKDATDRLARWTVLTRYLAAPLPPLQSGTFPYEVPVELWPQWFALGVQITDDQWADWLRWVTLDKLRQAWPAVARYQPAVAERSLAWLVAPLSVGHTDDPIARRLSYGAPGGYLEKEMIQSIQFLHGRGVRLAQPRWLAAAYASTDSKAELDFAISHGLVKLPPPSLREQAALAPLGCEPVAGPALRRALTLREPLAQAGAQEAPQETDVDTLQPIAMPGQTQCLWLRTQGEWGGRKSVDEEDFFQGVQRMRPCTEAQLTSTLWREDQARWLPVSETSGGELVAIQVRLQSQQHAAFVSLGMDHGACGNAVGGVVDGTFASDGSLAFRALQPGHPVFDALALQCNFADLGQCLGLAENAGHADARLDRNAFADKYWAVEKQAFLVAVDQLDRAAFDRARSAGLFPHWLDTAAVRVSEAADLPLSTKRRSMAWLLAQRQLLTGLSSETLVRLAVWLPAEDWGPIIQSHRCSNPYGLKEVQRVTQEHKLVSLNGQIRRALAIPCP